MRIVVVGAGAIGGFVGGKLAAAGHDVTFVDRPFFAEAVRDKGLRIIEPDNTTTIHPTVVTQLAEAFRELIARRPGLDLRQDVRYASRG